MPSSLIIVALAAAWLVVLVPMIARKRQEIARTADSAMAARVVRSGSASHEGGEEFAMSETAKPAGKDDEVVDSAEADEIDEDLQYLEELEHVDGAGQLEDYDDEEPDEPVRPAAAHSVYDEEPAPSRPYRPGRGGFDPEAAEIAARAKYAHRQRVVLGMIIAVVVTAVLAGFLWPMLWWGHGLVDVALVAYLGYLRRQVRIENEIRQRRLARLNNTRPARPAVRRARVQPEPEHDVEVVDEPRHEPVAERRPSPSSRIRQRAVVVDPEDEDPAFHELDEPGQQPFRRASGE
ncbi:gephyrin-like molybdotransferase receptor GlpR [Amycolatopsis anabasis]|uniref:divisome protein SepX/GlpR n=1 Tax=Amycolatopsis anabasis TaxID=1840409 RepID=UPI00131CC352|nr:gephyrin-like molybdotransferase receptor GlpR [Amycolatopsis anabasis]